MRLSTLCGNITLCLAIMFSTASLQAADYPEPQEGTWIVKDFRLRDSLAAGRRTSAAGFTVIRPFRTP